MRRNDDHHGATAQPQRVLDWQDPLTDETRALLDRLGARYRPRD